MKRHWWVFCLLSMLHVSCQDTKMLIERSEVDTQDWNEQIELQMH